MKLEYRPSGTIAHFALAAIALLATVVLVWLVSIVAGDYYLVGEQQTASHMQAIAHQLNPAAATQTSTPARRA